MDNLEEVVRRPKRYDYVDGTGDLFVALALLGTALADRLEALLPANAPRWEHAFALPVILLAVGAGWPLRNYIKKRWTWRRTGYVAYHCTDKRSLTAMAAATFIGGFAAVVLARMVILARQSHEMSLVAIGAVVLFAGTYAMWSYATTREHRWKWLIFLLMVVGLLVIELPAHGDLPRAGWQMWLFLGLAWLASAVGTLVSYIRHTQPSAAGAE